MTNKEMIEERKEQIDSIKQDIYECFSKSGITLQATVDFYNLGYRKLSEDSVVLSREELEEKYESSETFMAVVRELEELKADLEDKIVLSREEYVKKVCEEYEEGIKNCKFHYEIFAIPHIVQVVKDKPDIGDAEVEELIKQLGIEIKE